MHEKNLAKNKASNHPANLWIRGIYLSIYLSIFDIRFVHFLFITIVFLKVIYNNPEKKRELAK